MTLSIPAPDGGEFSAYMALPRKGRGPGLVLLQEIFGVNKSIRETCDWLASRQFTVIAPDLFWRTKPGVELAENDFENARALRMQTDDNQASDDAATAIAFLKNHAACTGRVGVIGYCWGGMLSYLTAVRHKPDAAVGYYGVGIEKKLDLAKNLACHLMLHYAGQDKFAGPEVAQQVRAGFAGDSRVAIHEYPKSDHAFARPGGVHFDPPAADLANMRTLSFLVDRLVGNR
jgi:carboxymethylenebutenolidase